MPTIALLDDRGDQRETILRLIKTQLPAEWNCIEAPLFADVSKFPGWLLASDVQVLLVDYKLDEHSAEKGSVAVDYKAPSVFAEVRKTMPNFPIFVLTAFPDDEQLKQHISEAEAVIHRRKFAAEITVHIPRMLRAANRFAEEHQKKLAELSALASAAAAGRAGTQDLERMKSLQAEIGLGVDLGISADRRQLLSDLEGKLTKMEKLTQDIESFLKKRGQSR